MSVEGFGADFSFYLSNDDPDRYIYGLVNLAAFLANVMVESIRYDSCDELNWQAVAGRYALSNSCGQQGRSYQDEMCEQKFTCEVDTMMKSTAVDSGKGVRAPPPFTCGPGSGEGYYSGYWDTSTGSQISDTPYSSTSGRTDVEGCCWWGRGALLTRNVCNIGKLNYYLGSQAALDGRPALYPSIDFCQDPEATCSSQFSEEMRWTVAMFEWAERIQRYTSVEWSYQEQLTKFVDGGMKDDSFIMSTARVLTNGCPEIDCSTVEVRLADQRKENFYLIINDIFDVKHLNTQKPTKMPIRKVVPTVQVATSTTSTVYAPTSQPMQAELSPPVATPSLYEEDEEQMTSYEPTTDALLISLQGNGAMVARDHVHWLVGLLGSIAMIVSTVWMLL